MVEDLEIGLAVIGIGLLELDVVVSAGVVTGLDRAVDGGVERELG